MTAAEFAAPAPTPAPAPAQRPPRWTDKPLAERRANSRNGAREALPDGLSYRKWCENCGAPFETVNPTGLYRRRLCAACHEAKCAGGGYPPIQEGVGRGSTGGYVELKRYDGNISITLVRCPHCGSESAWLKTLRSRLVFGGPGHRPRFDPKAPISLTSYIECRECGRVLPRYYPSADAAIAAFAKLK